MSTGTNGRFGPGRARKYASRNGLPAVADLSAAAIAIPHQQFITVPFFAIWGLNPAVSCDVWQERTVTNR